MQTGCAWWYRNTILGVFGHYWTCLPGFWTISTCPVSLWDRFYRPHWPFVTPFQATSTSSRLNCFGHAYTLSLGHWLFLGPRLLVGHWLFLGPWLFPGTLALPPYNSTTPHVLGLDTYLGHGSSAIWVLLQYPIKNASFLMNYIGNA